MQTIHGYHEYVVVQEFYYIVYLCIMVCWKVYDGMIIIQYMSVANFQRRIQNVL